jgi:tetratricopeptide (TPR) repeat protein
MLAKKRRLNVAFRIGLSLSLLYCIYLTGRQAVAAWYFQEQTPDSIHKAIHWGPRNAKYYATLARILQFSQDQEGPAELVQLYEAATRLSPHQAQYWAGLAGAYEWAGRLEDAARAYERARQLFPNSPDINWSAANFHVRRGETGEALHALRKTLLADPEMRRHVFELAWHAGANSKLILEETVPDSPDILFPYISYLIDTQRMDEAEQAWSRLLERGPRFEVREAFPYLDALIQHRRVDHLRAAWGAVAERFPGQVPGQSSDSDLVTNGSFEQEILNGGLDWRITPVEGVVVSADNQAFFNGVRSLRIEFDGRHNVKYSRVAVRSG